MIKKHLQTAGSLLAVLAIFTSSASVFAEGGTSGSGTTSTHTTNSSEVKTATPSKTESTSDSAKQKLAEDKAKAEAERVRVCENRKTETKGVEGRVSERNQNQLNAYTKIAERVENLYKTKGYSVSNYDALVADVNAKKATAQAAVTALQNDTASLSTTTCEAGQGKAKVTQFRADLKTEKSAQKA